MYEVCPPILMLADVRDKGNDDRLADSPIVDARNLDIMIRRIAVGCNLLFLDAIP